MTAPRVDWVDYAKGVCIILVVMMHSVLDYQELVGATGWLDPVVAFAKPFRMPDFFAIAGLFLYKSINGPKVEYVDRKLIHFIYFYVLWLVIQSLFFDGDVLISDPAAYAALYGRALIDPITTLWFVHMLALFYMATWAVRAVPKWIVLLVAVAMQTAFAMDHIQTGWTVVDRFCAYFVYFYVGYAVSPAIFGWAAWIGERAGAAFAGLLVWFGVNFALVSAGWAPEPGVSLVLGLAGSAAIMTLGVFVAKSRWFEWLRYAGQHSIVIYLTFFLPMKATQLVLSRTGLVPDIGTATLIVLVAGVAGPLVFHWIIKGTPANLLYKRPRWFSISQRYRGGGEARIAAGE